MHLDPPSTRHEDDVRARPDVTHPGTAGLDVARERWARRQRSSGRRLAAGTVSLGVGFAMVVLLPRVLGTTWPSVLGGLAAVAPRTVAVLFLVWAAGLFSYSFVLTGSLPGLTRARALLLNLSGSAVASAVPLGGALGVWLNVTMLRRWGFSGRQSADFTVVSNVVDVVGKLALCGGLLTVASVLGTLPQGTSVALLAGAAVVAVGLIAVLLLSTGTAGRWRASLVAGRQRVLERLRRNWPGLGLGAAGYVVLQGLLFVLCVELVLPSTGLLVVLAAFAVDRLTSMVPLTPSGAGFAEAGASAVLIAGGAQPGVVLAGVLLYRVFIVALEVPVGAIALAGWLLARQFGSPRGLPARDVS